LRLFKILVIYTVFWGLLLSNLAFHSGLGFVDVAPHGVRGAGQRKRKRKSQKIKRQHTVSAPTAFSQSFHRLTSKFSGFASLPEVS
jgi:hypothetical protein